MNGARFVHDQLELAGWQVLIADAQKVKGWPRWPARPTESTPGCWPSCRAGPWSRDLAAHPSGAGRAGTGPLQVAPGAPPGRAQEPGACHPARVRRPCATSDLFGVGGRGLLDRLALPEPWAGSMTASLQLLDELDERVDACERELRRLGADHPEVPCS
jgi:transposase